jgi:hypothetical protein
MQNKKFASLFVTTLMTFCVTSAFAQDRYMKAADNPCTFPDDKALIERMKADDATKNCYAFQENPHLMVEQQPRVIVPPKTLPSGTWGTPGTGTTPGTDFGTYLYFFKDIVEFLQKNKAVTKIELPYVSALPFPVKTKPEIQDRWGELEDWTGPKAVGFEVTLKNLFGMEVVRFPFTVEFMYAGSFGGKGQYILNAQVVPGEISCYPGFTLTVDSKVSDLINFGKKDDPDAGVKMNVHWKAESIFTKEGTYSFVMAGDGRFWQVQPVAAARKGRSLVPIAEY